MNPLVKFVLKVTSSPKINMQEDYPKVRKLQRILAPKPKKGYVIFDHEIYSEDRSHNIPVRVFHPKEQLHPDALLFFHGGGWVIGDIETYTNACINMADMTGRVVYSVDYRLAPEHPYPAGLYDCYRVAEVLMTHLKLSGLTDASQLTLIGDSAGGNLAAAVSLLLRDRGQVVPARQILLYPVTYGDHTEASPFESIRTYGYDYGMTSKKVEDFMSLYVPEADDRENPYVAPLMAKDLSNQPETLVITAEFDPLRDEGEAYAFALQKAGNKADIHRVNRIVHGFINFPKFTYSVVDAYKQINAFLNGMQDEGIDEETE